MASVLFERIGSYSEMQERLRKSPHFLVLGSGDEAHREYLLGTTSSCTIGICSQGHGPTPVSLVDEQSNEAWIGFSCNIANVDLGTCRVRFVITLDGVFFTILSRMEDGSVIVVHELGACRVGRSGRLIWNCATDVVTDFSEDLNNLRLVTDEGETRVSKETGAQL